MIDTSNSAAAVTQRGMNTASHIGAPAQNGGLKAVRREKSDDSRGVHDEVHVGDEDEQQMQMGRLRTMARSQGAPATDAQADANPTQQQPDNRFASWGPPGGGNSLNDFVNRAADGIKNAFDRVKTAMQPPTAGPGTPTGWGQPSGWGQPNAGATPAGLQRPFALSQPPVFGGPPNGAAPGGPPNGAYPGAPPNGAYPGAPMYAAAPGGPMTMGSMGMFPGAQMTKSSMMAMFMSMMPGGMMLAMPFMWMAQAEQQKQMMATIQTAMAGGPGGMPPPGPWGPNGAPPPGQWGQQGGPPPTQPWGQASTVEQPWSPASAPLPPAVAAVHENVRDFQNYIQLGTALPARGYTDASNRLKDQVDYWMQDHSSDPALNADDKAFASHVRENVQGYLHAANERLRASGVPDDQKEVHFTRYLAEAITRDAGEQGPRFPGLWVAGQQLINAGLAKPEESFIAGVNQPGAGAPQSPVAQPPPTAGPPEPIPTAAPAAPAPPPPNVTVTDGFVQDQGVIRGCREIRTATGTPLQRVAEIVPRGGDASQMLTITEDIAKGTVTVSRGDDIVSVVENARLKLPDGKTSSAISIEDKNRRDRGSFDSSSQTIGVDGSTSFSREVYKDDGRYWERDTDVIRSSADGVLSGNQYSRWQTGNDNFKRNYDLEVTQEADGTLRADKREIKPFIPFNLLAKT